MTNNLHLAAGSLTWWACTLSVVLIGAVLGNLFGARLVPARRKRLSKAQHSPLGVAALLAPISLFAVAEKLPHTGSAALPLLVVGLLTVLLCGVGIGAQLHAMRVPVLERRGGRPYEEGD